MIQLVLLVRQAFQQKGVLVKSYNIGYNDFIHKITLLPISKFYNK